MKIHGALPGLLAALLLGGALAAPLPAQDIEEARRRAEQLLGRPLSDRDILRLLQQSGLTPAQVRQRLTEAGLDPAAADPYLDVLEGRADAIPAGTSPLDVVQALTGVQLAEISVRDTGAALGALAPPTGALAVDTVLLPPAGPPIFGQELFRRATSQFEPVLTGPVPPDYRVGPGDELVLVLTGDVELAYRITVSREGWIIIPDMGRVFASGRTLARLQQDLTERLSQVYSGLTGDAEATTFLDVTLGTLRTNQIFIVGEVERPGAYTLSSLTTTLGALYWAGGPSQSGSFRRIALNRGGRTVATLDLYEYLLGGRAEQDARLENGDVLFVPVARRRVEVDGAIVRPAIYELREGEGLRDVLEFAGGPRATAHLARLQIERLLPSEDPTEGRERVLLDVPLGDLGEAGAPPVPLADGDRITVFAVLDDFRNTVQVSGGVWRPGVYGAEPGLRLWELIQRAGGLLPDVFEGRAQIQRLQVDQTRRLIGVTLARDEGGRPVEDPEIEPMDQVLVFARRDLRDDRTVTIGGWVRRPGEYPFAEGMTVRDLILRAGGVRAGGYVERAEVARVLVGATRGDTITRYLSVPLDSTLVFDRLGGGGDPGGGADDGSAPGRGGADDGDEGGAGGGGRVGADAAGDFPLQSMDAVYVRRLPGFEPQRTVVVSGEVAFPGPYSLGTREERLLDLVERAGGLTESAYPEGMELWRLDRRVFPDSAAAARLAALLGDTALARTLRAPEPDTGAVVGQVVGEAVFMGPAQAAPLDTQAAAVPPGDTAPGLAAPPPLPDTIPRRSRIGVDLARALRSASGSHNLLLQAGDSIHVPAYIPTVAVRGAVAAPGRVLYRRGEGVDYYLEQAGGLTRDGDKKRTWVEYASGERATRGSRFLFFGGGAPDPDPGSAIFVPTRRPGEGGVDAIRLVTLLTSVATAAATIIIVSNR